MMSTYFLTAGLLTANTVRNVLAREDVERKILIRLRQDTKLRLKQPNIKVTEFPRRLLTCVNSVNHGTRVISIVLRSLQSKRRHP